MSEPLLEALMSLDEAASHLADARNRLGNALRRVGLEEMGPRPTGAVMWANDDAEKSLVLARASLAAYRFAMSKVKP